MCFGNGKYFIDDDNDKQYYVGCNWTTTVKFFYDAHIVNN